MKTLTAATAMACLFALLHSAVVAPAPAAFSNPYPETQWLWEPVSKLAPGASTKILTGQPDGRGQLYTMSAGAVALFHLPRGYWLRLSAIPGKQATAGEHPVLPEAPATWYSQGNGLFVPALLQQSPHGAEWLLPPPVSGDIVVLLENNGQETAHWRLSRAVPQNLARKHARRETPLRTANKSTWYHQRLRGSHLQLARVQAGEKYSVSLTGPGEWRLEARMLADTRIKWRRFFEIPLRLNNQYWRDWRLHPSINHRDTLVAGQCQMISSDAESLHITLPEGEHTISFTAPATMAVRTLSLQSEDFFFSRNLTNPVLRGGGEQLLSHSAPTAQPPYDERLFAAFLNGEFSSVKVPPPASAINEEIQPRYTAARLIDQRYKFWRPLPVANVVRVGGQFELIDVVLSDPGRGVKRYVQQAAAPSGTGQLLLELNPDQVVELHAPDQRPQTTLKISLPVTRQPYDLALKNRRGETTVWRWRPDYIQNGALDLESDEDLALIGASSGSSKIATASTIFTIDRQDFPISLSHSARQTVLFSPFYRQEVARSLDQAGWENALDVLGRDKMLTLLLADSRPQARQDPSLEQRLELNVWDDWRPLRNWLSSYRKIWTRGLAGDTFAIDPLHGQQLPALIARLEGDALYLLEQLLRGVAARDPDPLRQQQALDWLHSHYKNADDTANLSAYYSWHLQRAPLQQLEATADWLVASGHDKMAIRLYRLAATSTDHLPYQQARLGAGWLQDQGAAGALLATWEAVWRQDWNSALLFSSRLGKSHPWRKFLSQVPGDNDPVSWLQWAYRAPAGNVERMLAATPTELDVSQSAQTLYFHATERDLPLQRALAEPESPVSYKLIGPLEVQLSLSLQHSNADETLSDWIEISANGNRKWFPVLRSKISPGIRQLTHPGDKYIGQQKRVTLSLGPGQFELQIKPMKHKVLVSARHLSPLLLAGLVSSFQQSGVSIPANTYATSELLKNLDIDVLGECRNGVSAVSADPAQIHSASALAAPPVTEGRTWRAPHTLSGDDSAIYGSASFDTDIETFLLQLLWRWPQTGDRERRKLIARANAAARPFLNQDRVRAYLDKLNEDHSWQLEEKITGSGGSRRVTRVRSSENPATNEREMLLYGPIPPAGERLHGHHQIGLFTRFNEPTQVVFDFRQAHLPYREAPPASLALTINDELLRSITLPPLQQQIAVTIPAGPQNLRLRLLQPTTDHWVTVQAHAEIDGHTQPLLEKKPRRYHVATNQQPLEIYFPEPRWVRIAEFNNGETTQRFHYQAEPGYLQLRPETGASMAMYRVFGWQPKSEAPALGPYKIAIAVASTQVTQQITSVPAEFRWGTAVPYDLSVDQGGNTNALTTDGLFLELKSRRDFDTDVSSDEEEQFLEAGWRHRRALDCLACYWRSDVYARKHVDADIKLVGTDQWLQGRWPQSSWRWALQQSLLVQTGSATDWSWLGAASLIETHAINEKMEHEYALQAFGRYLSADGSRQPMDNDIYTRYKEQHRHGVKLGTTLRGRPWLDTRWAVEAGLTSNEDLNPLQPDYLQAAVSWRQYWRPLAFTVVYRHRLYLADDDRQDSAHRPQLRFAVNSLTGFQAGKILQWALQFDYDLDRDEYGFALSLNWDYSRGRGLRDFHPSRSSFHSLRNQELNANLYRRQAMAGTNHGR